MEELLEIKTMKEKQAKELEQLQIQVNEQKTLLASLSRKLASDSRSNEQKREDEDLQKQKQTVYSQSQMSQFPPIDSWVNISKYQQQHQQFQPIGQNKPRTTESQQEHMLRNQGYRPPVNMNQCPPPSYSQSLQMQAKPNNDCMLEYSYGFPSLHLDRPTPKRGLSTLQVSLCART